MPIIEFKNVSFEYEPKKLVLDRLSFVLNTGDKLALTGDSGSGKTTVLRLLLGLERPTDGKITGLGECRFSTVFQEDRLIPSLTAEQNVMVVKRSERRSSEETDFRDFVNHLFQAAGLSAFLKKYPSELSGGQRRRIAILRAVAYGGDILLLDEPLKGLDSAMKCCMANLIEDNFNTIFLVSHEKEEIELLHCSRTIHLPSKLLP